jgi:hypothetical protein
MKKEYLVGGLAVLGAIALVAYFKKPKRNSEGFFGASGSRTLTSRGTRGNCAYCRTSAGDVYHTGEDRTCSGRDVCVTRYSYLS